ncbi:MAG: hypothetical protein K0S47_4516 [Herbinix sp.]|jgi:hypothetical protein|nr:hypothetical protein [Herbinix sp.]MDF2845493.1 hypothetical protein [Herbinix sp.]
MELNNPNQTYFILLKDTLKKKIGVLEELLKYTLVQEKIIDNGDIENEEFFTSISEKEQQLNILLQLDDGFEQIYQRIKDSLLNYPKYFEAEVKELKDLITVITDLNIKLQALEKRNKTKMDNVLMKKRLEIKNFKANNQMVSNYYKNMANQHQDQSYFLDKKN